jgi:5-methylcytosine-specific restriction protein B
VEAGPKVEPYDLTLCATNTGLSLPLLESWKRAIERKKQAVIYGPPGTGKTYVARELAKHLSADGDGFWDLVQFHPAYGYEDFLQGIQPKAKDGGGLDYPMIPGRFLEFCDKAEKHSGTCVLIVDEMNRANLGQVFGELMYLLEYREEAIPLAGGMVFHIPANVRLIGTMNTADRSIALVDHALRRRFAFLHLPPQYGVLELFQKDLGFDASGLVAVLKQVNATIEDPKFALGISFFLRKDLDKELEDIWRMEIEPYLEEFFYQEPKKVEYFRWESVTSKIHEP